MVGTIQDTFDTIQASMDIHRLLIKGVVENGDCDSPHIGVDILKRLRRANAAISLKEASWGVANKLTFECGDKCVCCIHASNGAFYIQSDHDKKWSSVYPLRSVRIPNAIADNMGYMYPVLPFVYKAWITQESFQKWLSSNAFNVYSFATVSYVSDEVLANSIFAHFGCTS